MRISKKIIAIALSVLMAVSMMPFTVFADALPTATVTDITHSDENELGLEAAYKYEATATAAGSKYADYLADFVITVDKDLPAGAIELWGKYAAELSDNTGNWTKLEYNEAIEADKEYHLLQMSGYWPITYSDVADIIQTFYCGVNGLDAAGATMTVELKLFENAEDTTGIEIPSAKVEYTFPEAGNDFYSITESADIDFNIFVEATENVAAVKYTYNKLNEQEAYAAAEVTKTVSELTPFVVEYEGGIANCYEYSIVLAPGQIADEIKVEILNENGDAIREHKTSVKEYCEKLMAENDEGSELYNLAAATLDYGKAAAEFFDYTPYNGAFGDYNLGDATIDNYTISVPAEVKSVSYVAYSTPALRFVVDIAEADAAELTPSATIGTASYVKYEDGTVVLQIKDVLATDLDSTIHIDLGNGEAFDYVPLHIAKALADKGFKLGHAIANYNAAADAYFNA